MQDFTSICKSLRTASVALASLSSKQKDRALSFVKESIAKNRKAILNANAIDMDGERKKGMTAALLERLALDEKKIDDILSSIDTVISLSDPIGEVVAGWRTKEGLKITQVRVPMGVVAIIYESRPNVTVDAFCLAYKSANAILLRGSSAAINSNIAIESAIKEGLVAANGCPKALYLLKSGERSEVDSILSARGLIDVLLPRGGAALIRTVTEKSTVPVIQTGEGVCHLYIDATANIDMALNIAKNAKCQRPGACNAIECIVVHEAIANAYLPRLDKLFFEANVKIFADERALPLMKSAKEASEDDWGREFLSLCVAVKVVDSLNEAVDFINAHNTHHSDAIVTKDLEAARYFKEAIDSACVYVNASTRFTDGGMFGFGAELGISTQKLHARGPMGIKALTTTKYIIDGDGQVR